MKAVSRFSVRNWSWLGLITMIFWPAVISVSAQNSIPNGDRGVVVNLPSQELKGTIIPDEARVRYYSFEAGPGDISFSLEVKTYNQWSGISVQLLSPGQQTLLEGQQTLLQFEASSSGDKKEAKFHCEQRQLLILRISAPRNNQSGAYTLKLKGPIFLNKTLASNTPAKNPDPTKPNPPTNNPTASPTNSNSTSSRSGDEEKSTIQTNPGANYSSVNEITTDKKIALVIGNSKYQVAPLTNPENDARAMADTLREAGFEVLQYTNLNKREFEESVRVFGNKINRGGVALFFFAGHGMQVRGTNYLIPVGANIQKETDVEYEAVDAGRVMSELETAGSRLNIVILDACRNNPFARSFRAATRGLAVMSAPSGTVVAYATGPGEVASDGDGKNGLYTQELLRNMREPNMKIEDVLKRTRISVKEKTRGQQVPWENTSLDGDFYFRKK